MNLFRKKAFLLIFILIFAVFSAYAVDNPIDDLQKNVVDLSTTLAKSLPFNSALGLNWSDAYIGKFFPSLPPHFGVGGTFGVTTLDMPALKGVADLLGYQIPTNPLLTGKMIIPAWAAEARIGGLFLPFDVGVKFGTLPSIKMMGIPYSMKYTMAGADIRWAVLDGKSNLLLPNLSIGVGFNYLSGGIGASIGSDTSFDIAGKALTISKPQINLLWETKGIEAKAQISKQILILTPYIGVGAGYSWSQAGYDVKADTTYDGDPIDPDVKAVIKQYLTDNGLQQMTVAMDGISSIIKNEAWNFRAFGGVSFNILILKLDLTLMYNLIDTQLGASLSARVQL
ncbi:MAG: hypothetical protein FWD78_03545 [Treponema sp.]|nr:hypothetical protein [Treponema sp.]